MNIENISALAAQLKNVGFENMGYAILKRICLLPPNFLIREKIAKESGQVIFNFYFEREKKSNNYRLEYYDAIFQKELTFSDFSFEEISISELEENMKSIDWNAAFDFNIKQSFNPDDRLSYEKEQRVEQAINDLSRLEMNESEKGKQVAIALKQKYWSDIPYNNLMGNLSPIKNKSELSQRFYCAEGQPVISADEAYRFLQNKWVEKELQIKRKRQDNIDESEPSDDPQASPVSSLLKKRKAIGAIKFKRTKSSQD